MKKLIAKTLGLLCFCAASFGEGWWEVSESKQSVLHYYEYDESGNVIYSEKPSGFKEWREFTSFGKLSHYKNTSGDEIWYEYDSRGNAVSFKTQLGDLYSCTFKYDKNYNLIEKEIPGNEKTVYEYDSKNRLIHEKSDSGYERWYSYDSKGNKISEKEKVHFPDGKFSEKETQFKYDGQGNLISSIEKIKNSEKSGSSKIETKYEYNSDGKRTKIFVNGKVRSEYFYDSKNHLISEKNYVSGGNVEVKNYEYTYYPNGKIKSMKVLQ